MSSFKSSENIHKKEDGSYYAVSANKASSVTLLLFAFSSPLGLLSSDVYSNAYPRTRVREGCCIFQYSY